MVQIIGQEGLGEKLGTGLGAGLRALTEGKLRQMQARNQQTQTQKGLAQIPGFTPEMAEALSGLDPQILNQIVKSQLAAPGEQAYGQAINQLLGGESEGGMKIPEGTRLNSQQATNLANLSVQKEKRIQEHQQKKQAAIDATNKSWNENLDKQLGVNQQVLNIALERKKLLDTGKVYTGWLGKLPKEMQNTETQEYSALGDQLAPLLASTTGQATNLKTKLAGSSKGDVSNTAEAQKNINDYTIKKAEDFLKKGSVRADLIAKNKGLQPENLSSLVDEIWKKPQSKTKENNGFIESIDEVVQELSKNNAPIGTEVEDDEGNVLYWNGHELVEEKPNGL